MFAKSAFHIMANPVGPTCNLRCTHCYYLEKAKLYPDSKDFKMSDQVLEKYAKSYIEAMPEGVAEVQFAWQGGEPTMAGLDFFKHAVELQKKYSRDGLKVANALQTNGTLLDDAWGKFLHDENFLVGISIDGPEQTHNRYRPDAQGEGSFNRVMSGLEVLKKHKVEFNALVCVQGDNAGKAGEVYGFLKDAGVSFFQFIPIVEPVRDGRPADECVKPGQWGEFLNTVFDIWLKADVGQVFIQHFETVLAIVMGNASSLCVHARRCGRALALEFNGDLYSCDHFVNQADLLGNIEKNALIEMVDGKKQGVFGRNKEDALPGHCRECEFLGLCWGGCPAGRTRKTPKGEAGLNYLCEGYREFYKHTIPYFKLMAACLRAGRPAGDFIHGPCVCGSGQVYRECCGK